MSRSSFERGGGVSRADKFLGYSSAYNTSTHDPDDVSELHEEDVWDFGADGSRSNNPTLDGNSSNSRPDSSDTYRFLNTGMRWVGLDQEPGLSAAFADHGSRAYGRSPHKLVGGFANYAGQSSSREARGIATPLRMIPAIAQIREDSPRQMMHQSAPVNVPDWSKILGAEKKHKWADEDADSDKEDEQEERLPPHLHIQREYAQSQMTTFSVCEGAGRTLKGRDLSRVRNAVLRQTGFLD